MKTPQFRLGCFLRENSGGLRQLFQYIFEVRQLTGQQYERLL